MDENENGCMDKNGCMDEDEDAWMKMRMHG